MKFILLIFLSIILSQDVYEGYVIYTPASGGGGSSATTYLKDVDGSIFNLWSYSILCFSERVAMDVHDS